MYRTIVTAALWVICALPVPAFAAPLTNGNDWLTRCQDGTTSGDAGKATYCFSYARGLADGLSIWAVISPETALACIPTEIQGQDLVDVGMRYLKNHPEMRSFAAGVPLTRSFVEAWPCKQVQPSIFRPAN